MIPLDWANGIITALAIKSEHMAQNGKHIFLQLFYPNKERNYVIENVLFKQKDNGDLEAAPLNAIPELENVAQVIRTESPIKPFVVDRMNIANNIDASNPMGISVFANAIDAMKTCDIIFDSLRSEFELGKKRIMVRADMVNFENGAPVFDPNDIAFYQLPGGTDNTPFIKDSDMNLRVPEHVEALQHTLNIFSAQCGLGENYYRYSDGAISTATQVISENNTLYRTLKKHEIVLDAVLTDLVRLVIHIGQRMMGRSDLNESAGVTIQFDDSIIEDKEADIKRWQWEVSAGILKPEIYLSRRYGVTEEAAREMMPTMSQVIE